MAEPRLYIDPELVTYAADRKAVFLEALAAQDRHTIMAPLDQPEQLLMTPDCRTQRGGFRYSGTAFRQLCRTACPGLTNVVTDVAGLRRRSNDTDRGRFSLADAISVFNTVVRRRFRTDLEGLQTVRDTRTGVIEGVVGRGYRRLANIELYNRSDEVLRSYRQPVEFYSASMYGRHMVLHYRDRSPMFTTEGPRGFQDVFYGGFYYSNSEIGDGSVRATTTLIRACTDTKALGYFGRSGRLIHAGKAFSRRFEMLLNSVGERRPEVDRLREGVLALATKNLGFTGNDDDFERRFIELSNRLQSKQLTKSLARRILRSVLVQSSYDRTPIADIRFVRQNTWTERTAYDLFNAMTRTALDLPITLRERVEQLAFSLLLGRFTL